MRVGNRPELIFSTLAAALGVVTSLVGWSGILLNNRSFLAVYTFMLWICFAFLVTPGYITYKRRTFNLEGKINAQWSRSLGADGRLRIQNQLQCCGYFSPFVEATVSQTCYARSILPGCKKHYLDFEKLVLKRWYIVAFAIVPLHIAIMVAGLLCSNHVTYRFGKGMMPKAYRLSMNSMAVIMDNYAKYVSLFTRFLCILTKFLVVNWRNNTVQTSPLRSWPVQGRIFTLTPCPPCLITAAHIQRDTPIVIANMVHLEIELRTEHLNYALLCPDILNCTVHSIFYYLLQYRLQRSGVQSLHLPSFWSLLYINHFGQCYGGEHMKSDSWIIYKITVIG